MSFNPEETIAQDAEAVAPEAGAAPNGLGSRLLLLLQPDPRTPEQYVGKPIASGLNKVLGEAGEKALLGESVNLCLDVVGAPGAGDLPPVVHLGWSGFKFFWFRRKPKKDEKKPDEPKTVRVV